MRLTDDELRDVLARAEELDASRHGEPARAELERVIGAAAEVGLSRSAVERALRERLDLPLAPPEPGELAFVQSADGQYYVAEVVSYLPNGVRVKFLSGSEHIAAHDQIRPCSFIPGEKVMVDWPWWGPWECTVMSYDAARGRITANDGWGFTETFPIAEVWRAPKKRPAAGPAKTRAFALFGAGAGLGALLASIVAALLLR
jgi:hypothetical protein